MKRYISKNRVSVLLKGRIVTFRDEGGSYALSTSDAELSEAIEGMAAFRRGLIRLAGAPAPAPARRDTSGWNTGLKRLTAEREARKGGMEVVEAVRTCADAKQLLTSRFGDECSRLRTRQALMDAAQERGISFPNLVR